MSLFEEQLHLYKTFCDTLGDREIFWYSPKIQPHKLWPRQGEERCLVLSENMALELGNPRVGSIGSLLWTPNPLSKRDKVGRIGPDIQDIKNRTLAFAQIVVATAYFESDYEGYLDMQESLRCLDLKGITRRSLPSRHNIWYRISNKAAKSGFSLTDLGNAIISDLKAVNGVETVQVLFVTEVRDSQDYIFNTLGRIAEESGHKIGALIKRNEEQEMECEQCDFSDICDGVESL